MTIDDDVDWECRGSYTPRLVAFALSVVWSCPQALPSYLSRWDETCRLFFAPQDGMPINVHLILHHSAPVCKLLVRTCHMHLYRQHWYLRRTEEIMFQLSRRERRLIPPFHQWFPVINSTMDVLTRRYAGKRPCRCSRRAVMASGMLGIIQSPSFSTLSFANGDHF